ncbi:hypothetical protein GCM10027051_16060 [Niabella terrae]
MKIENLKLAQKLNDRREELIGFIDLSCRKMVIERISPESQMGEPFKSRITVSHLSPIYDVILRAVRNKIESLERQIEEL